LIIFSFAYSYETVKYFSKIYKGISISLLDNVDFEGEDKDSGKSNDKNEKLNFSEDLFFINKHLCHNLIANPGNSNNFCSLQNVNFSSSDYSQQVYSPPDIL
jgi:hypothetical protein